MLTSDGKTVRLTAKGRLLSNDVFQEFLGVAEGLEAVGGSTGLSQSLLLGFRRCNRGDELTEAQKAGSTRPSDSSFQAERNGLQGSGSGAAFPKHAMEPRTGISCVFERLLRFTQNYHWGAAFAGGDAKAC